MRSNQVFCGFLAFVRNDTKKRRTRVFAPTIQVHTRHLLVLYLARVFAVFDGGDFGDAALVPAAGEVGGEPDFHNFSEHNLADEVAGDAEDIRVIMLTRDLRV